jgi:hypothetical protein
MLKAMLIPMMNSVMILIFLIIIMKTRTFMMSGIKNDIVVSSVIFWINVTGGSLTLEYHFYFAFYNLFLYKNVNVQIDYWWLHWGAAFLQ